MNMAYRKNSDEGGKGRQRYANESRSDAPRSRAYGPSKPRTDRDKKPYAYTKDNKT